MNISEIACELDETANLIEFLSKTYIIIEGAMTEGPFDVPGEALHCPNDSLCNYVKRLHEVIEELYKIARKEDENGNYEKAV